MPLVLLPSLQLLRPGGHLLGLQPQGPVLATENVVLLPQVVALRDQGAVFEQLRALRRGGDADADADASARRRRLQSRAALAPSAVRYRCVARFERLSRGLIFIGSEMGNQG